jgi:glycosyltransferase involved in cell wall biosynthesis
MKILMIAPYLPYPLHSGGQTRSYNLIKNLSRKHEITLFCFVRSPEENKFVKSLAPYCVKIKTFVRGKTWSPKKILFAGLTPYPFLVANYYSSELKKAIREELKNNQYRLVHVECFYLMPNVPKTKLPKVLVDQTIEYEVYRHYTKTLPWYLWPIKLFYYFDVAKIFFWEKHFWQTADQTCAVSEDDEKLMKRHCPKTNFSVVKNGVSLESFAKNKFRKSSRPTILFGVANFKWIQNKEAASILIEEVWPKIKKKLPSAQLWIIGRYAPQFYSSFAKKDKNITVKEADDILYFYQKAWLLLAPIKSGGGSRTKFFEAMASSLPIITTPQGIEGIAAKHNQEVVIGKTNQQLVSQTIKLIADKKRAREIGQKAKKLVLAKYSWEESAKTLDLVYQQVIKSK